MLKHLFVHTMRGLLTSFPDKSVQSISRKGTAIIPVKVLIPGPSLSILVVPFSVYRSVSIRLKILQGPK